MKQNYFSNIMYLSSQASLDVKAQIHLVDFSFPIYVYVNLGLHIIFVVSDAHTLLLTKYKWESSL